MHSKGPNKRLASFYRHQLQPGDFQQQVVFNTWISGGLSDSEIEQREDRPLREGGEIMLETKIKTYTNTLKDIQHEIDVII